MTIEPLSPNGVEDTRESSPRDKSPILHLCPAFNWLVGGTVVLPAIVSFIWFLRVWSSPWFQATWLNQRMGWDAGDHWFAALELSQLFEHGYVLRAFSKMNTLAAYWPPLPTLWTSLFHMIGGPSYSVAIFSIGMLAVIFTASLASLGAFAPVTDSDWNTRSPAADLLLGITAALIPWFLPLFQRYILSSMFEVAGAISTLIALHLFIANLATFQVGKPARWGVVGIAALAVVLVKYYYAIYLFGAFLLTAWFLIRGSRRAWMRFGSACAGLCLLLAIVGAQLGGTFSLGRPFIKMWLWGWNTTGLALLIIELFRSRHPFWRPFALRVLLPTAVWMAIPNPNRYWAIWSNISSTAGSECTGLAWASGCWGYYVSQWYRYGGDLLTLASVAFSLGLLFLMRRSSEYLRVWCVASWSYAVPLFLVMTFVSPNKQSRYIITLIPIILLGSVFFARRLLFLLRLRQRTFVTQAVSGASAALCAGLCVTLVVFPLQAISDRIFHIEAFGARPAGEGATLTMLFDELRTARDFTKVYFDYPYPGEFHARWLLHDIELGIATPPKFFGSVQRELLRSSDQWVGDLEDTRIQRIVLVTFENRSDLRRKLSGIVLIGFEKRVLGAGDGRIWILERRAGASRMSTITGLSPTESPTVRCTAGVQHLCSARPHRPDARQPAGA